MWHWSSIFVIECLCQRNCITVQKSVRRHCFQENGVTVFKYKLPNLKMAKLLWKIAVEHHAFFRYVCVVLFVLLYDSIYHTVMQFEYIISRETVLTVHQLGCIFVLRFCLSLPLTILRLKESDSATAARGMFSRMNPKYRYSGRTQYQTQMAANDIQRTGQGVDRNYANRFTGTLKSLADGECKMFLCITDESVSLFHDSENSSCKRYVSKRRKWLFLTNAMQ